MPPRTIRTHRCHGRRGCAAEVAESKLMCLTCWRLVPEDLQQRLYAAWNRGRGRGTDAHSEAMLACRRAVNA